MNVGRPDVFLVRARRVWPRRARPNNPKGGECGWTGAAGWTREQLERVSGRGPGTSLPRSFSMSITGLPFNDPWETCVMECFLEDFDSSVRPLPMCHTVHIEPHGVYEFIRATF